MTIDIFRIATHIDAEAIAELVNIAYCPESNAVGWTHESEWVSGDRTNSAQVLALIVKVTSNVLIALKHAEIVACVHIEKVGEYCHVGMFAVHPALQGAGLGKQLLAYAENYAVEAFGVEKFIMLVLSARVELLAFYLRRGYRQAGQRREFPLSAGVGVPKVPALTIDVLEKHIVNRCR